MIFRYLIAISVLTAPFAASADDSLQEYPAVEIQVQGAKGPVEIITAAVPIEQEQTFIHSEVDSPVSQDRTLIVYSDQDKGAEELDQVGSNRPDLSVHKVSREELTAATKEANAIGQMSSKDLRKAGILVTFLGLGFLTPSLYFSSSTAEAFMASLAYTGAMVLFNDRTTVLYDYLNASANKFESKAKRFFPNSPKAAAIGYNVGRSAASMSYSFASNSVTRFLINGFNLKDSIGSLAGLTNIASSVGFSFLTSSVWDFLFAKLRNSPDDEDKKTAQIMIWIKTLIVFAISPLMLNPATQLIGTGAMVAFGALGMYANYNNKPFVNGGRYILQKMESSERVSKIVTSSLNTQRRIGNWFLTLLQTVWAKQKCDVLLTSSP